MSRPINEMLAEAKQLQKEIDSGDLGGGKKLKRAKARVYALKYHAKLRQQRATKKATSITNILDRKEKQQLAKIGAGISESVNNAMRESETVREMLADKPKQPHATISAWRNNQAKQDAKRKNFNSAQGFLPHFLNQISKARIEELVAEMVFQALQRGLEQQSEESSVVPDFSKAK